MVVVHNDKPELTTSIIVASGSYLFVYRNLKPFFKYSLPPLETNQIELDAWTRFKDMRINIITLEEILINLRLEIGRRRLTSRLVLYVKFHFYNHKSKSTDHKCFLIYHRK